MDWGTPGGNNFFVTSGDHNMELNESSSDDSSPKNLVIDAGSAGATPTVSSPAMSIAEAHELFLPNPLLPPMGFGGEDAPVISANVNAHEKLVKFVGRTDVVTEELPPKVETQSLHSTSSHHHYQHHHQPHHHQHQHPPPPPPPSSSSSSSSAISPSPSYQHQHHQITSGAPGAPPHDPLGLGNSVPPLSHLINTHPQQQQQSQPLTSHTHLPHPHPPPPPPPPPPPYPYGTPPPPPQHQQQLSGSHYPGQQQLQWPNNASDIQQQQSSLLGMPPPSSASSHQGLLETPAAMRTPPMLPQSSSLPSGSGSGSSFRTGMGPQQQSQSLQNDLTPEHFQGPIQFLNSLHHQQHQHQHSGSGSGSGGAGTGTGPNYMCPSGTRIDIGNPIAKRRSSTSSVCFDDQNMEYSTLNWANHKITLLCPLNEEPHVAVPEISSKIFHDRTYLTLHRRNLLDIDTVSATSVQILALRARGSLDQFTGKTKLISLSSAVKLASDAGIPIPQNVLDECWKFSKVHQQDPNSAGTIRQPQPQNFSPVPINPSQLQKPSSLHHQHQHQLHHSHSHSHSAMRDELPFQRSGTNIASTTTIPAASADAVKRGLRSQSDLCSVPVHPDIVDLGPSFRTPDGTICHVRWDKEVFVVFMSSKGGNYVGLYQTYEMVFKQFTTSRMNFKMRMRKYSVRSIRAPSGIRVKMIELNALPPHSPVCGLIKVSEFDVLAKSYGVAIPGVFLDAFSSTVAKQQQQQAGKRLPNNASSGSSSKNSLSDGGGEVPIRYHDIDSSGVMTLSSNSQSPVKDSLVVSIPLTRFMSVSPMHESLTSASVSSNVPPPSSSSSSSSSSSFAFSSSSVPRNAGLHRAGPWHKTHPSASAASSNSSSSSIHQLAKRISRRYVSKGGMQVNRVCPKCHKVNPTGPKKRCMYCEEFLVGRACPSCGTLNHNRTKECFKCQSLIMYPGQGQGQERTHHSSNKAVTWYPPASVPVPTSAPTTGGALEATPPFLASAASPSSSLLLDHHLTHIQVQPFPSPSLPSSSSSSSQLRDTLLQQQQQQQQSVAMGNAQNVPHMTHTLYSMSNVEGGAGGSTCTSVNGGGGGVGSRVESATAEDDEGMEDSPFSPHDQFAPPPIRSAALKSMFPEEAQKPEDGAQLITKTVYSGSVSSTRQCRECGQLNSKMAKKCVQCRSPLQGRPCPQCSRPNHNHSTECYKCGTPLPPTATKWVYSGGRGNRVNQESGPIMQLAVGRAPISCIRCRRLKQHRRLKCGRCGDLFHTKPFFPLDVGGSSGGNTAAEEGLAEGGGGAMGAEGGRGGTKRRKGLGVELSPSFDDESDASLPASSLMRFARNIVQLGIDEGLVPLITEVESKCREKVYDAEEEYETLEEQYQEFLKGKCERENSFRNAQAELDGMMVELESYQREQTHWQEKEADAREVLVAIPDQRIQELQSKISSARQLLEL